MDHYDPRNEAAVRPFLRASIRVAAGRHGYKMGLQHRRTNGGVLDSTWSPKRPTVVMWLQNDLGATYWTATPERTRAVAEAFQVTKE
jgi:hypothetical protein